MGITTSQFNELVDGDVELEGGIIEAAEVVTDDQTFTIVDRRTLGSLMNPEGMAQVIMPGNVDSTDWIAVENRDVLTPIEAKMRYMAVYAGFWGAVLVRDRYATGTSAIVSLYGPGPGFLVPQGTKFVKRRRWWVGKPVVLKYEQKNGNWELAAEKENS